MRDDVSLLATLRKYAATPAPRYTSYPPATKFGAGVDAATLKGWLEAVDPDQPVSLYAHVPFCRQQCWYCGCNQKLAARYQPVSDFVTTLLADIDLVAGILPQGLSFQHLHFGGGTPTVLTPEDLALVTEVLLTRFTALPGAEIAIEVDPRTLEDSMIARLPRMGFNRVSIGVQEFDPVVQKAINRIQPRQMITDVVGALRAEGIEAINFDLMYGLPHQSAASLVETVEACATLRPDRIALFGYAHVPWFAKAQRLLPEEALPTPPQRADQALAARRALEAQGYVAIGIDHFALPHDPLAVAAAAGTLRRNFQGYTTDTAETLVGFGPSSITRTPQGYAQSFAETNAWTRAVEAGELPVERGLAFSGDDAQRADIIAALLCDGRARAEALGETLASLGPLIEDGLATLSGDELVLSEAGMMLARVVAAKVDAYQTAPQPGAPSRQATAL
jgi:oxygen-independent coproporphyrinogen-3 oxidase